MHIVCSILLILLMLTPPVWGKELPLFFIQRSKNKNEVHYRLNVDDRCQIVTEKPVGAFWKLLQESPEKTKLLTEFDHIAYGAVNQKVDDNWVSFNLRPLEERRVKATAIYNPETQTCAPIVHVEIHEQWVSLDRIYVHSEERLLRPKVIYIDVFGKSLDASPQHVTERIHP